MRDFGALWLALGRVPPSVLSIHFPQANRECPMREMRRRTPSPRRSPVYEMMPVTSKPRRLSLLLSMCAK